MEYQGLAVHRTIVAVDVEAFGDRRRTNRNQVAVRDGLYRTMQDAFNHAGIPWVDHDHEDRGDGIFILVSSEVPKSLFVEALLPALVTALHMHNDTHPDGEHIRLRMALHAGEVNYDRHGVTAASINLTFRLLDSDAVKEALASSRSVLAVITSPWFFEEVVQHSTADSGAYRPVRVSVKETTTTGWIYLPDQPDRSGQILPMMLPEVAAVAVQAAEQFPNRVRRALSLAYKSALGEPITPAGDMPVGLEIPALGEGYVDHRFRMAKITPSSEPGRDSWWAGITVNDSICNFLSMRTIPSAALEAPVLLFGQPGSGKSVLTRILAARLSDSGFLAIRVDLRQVQAEADLQDQIESAIHDTTGERIHWSQLLESRESTLSIVIFDGFDELLQAAGSANYDFLLRVQAFQEREARLGRPLVVVVTSRIAVTELARIPHGATVIRLEPFHRDQITAWLAIWARINNKALSSRGIKPLPVDVALRYKELSEQPLLLLMLTLYDAGANALQHHSAALSSTELYGRLLRDFSRREVRKNFPAMSEADLEDAVDDELLRLSIVAFAMFNRRSQWVPEAELDGDFSALLIDEENRAPQPYKSRAWLTSAQFTVGRFFFIHESQATYGNRPVHTYEFLHSTFGEFLVARLVVRILAEVAAAGAVTDRSSQEDADNGMLHALLSFAALPSRIPVVKFIGDLFDQFSEQQRTAITGKLLVLHSKALSAYGESSFDGYEPLALAVTVRHAAWSVNLVVLAVLAAGEITGTQLFLHEPDPGAAWRNEAMVWRAQLKGYGWDNLHQIIALSHEWVDGRREVRLWKNDGTFIPKAPDMRWEYEIPPEAGRKGIFTRNTLSMRRRVNLTTIRSEATLLHALDPLLSSFPAVANVFIVLDDERVVSATRALIAALYAPYQEDASSDSAYQDLAYVTHELMLDPGVERNKPYLNAAIGILISAVKDGRVSPEALEPIGKLTSDVTMQDPELAGSLARLDGILANSNLSGEANLGDK
jgi:hypothetical protein